LRSGGPERHLACQEPNWLWGTDPALGHQLTEHRTREGKVYCAAFLDTFSRRVVGWSIDAAPAATLTTDALGMAIENRRPGLGALIQSDHGIQFALWAFTRRAQESGLVPSMEVHRRLLRQRGDRVVLGPNVGRAAEPPTLEDSRRTRERDSSNTSRSSTN
jgi:transposase InsO family protein